MKEFMILHHHENFIKPVFEKCQVNPSMMMVAEWSLLRIYLALKIDKLSFHTPAYDNPNFLCTVFCLIFYKTYQMIIVSVICCGKQSICTAHAGHKLQPQSFPSYHFLCNDAILPIFRIWLCEFDALWIKINCWLIGIFRHICYILLSEEVETENKGLFRNRQKRRSKYANSEQRMKTERLRQRKEAKSNKQ